MTESNPVLVPASGDQMDIVDIGTIAAQNIALVLNLDQTHVDTIKKAIADEINVMSAHFTLAFRDVQDQYEIELAKLKGVASGVAGAACDRCDRIRARIDALFA